MRVLVTGATGFLGRSVVPTLLAREHKVRAVVRPSSDVSSATWRERIELFSADLCTHERLDEALEGIDAVVHLAAQVVGRDEVVFRDTVIGTERLLEAMRRTTTTIRMVLASSVTVYDPTASGSIVDEKAPLESDLASRNGYTAAKVWQERMVRRTSEEHGWRLAVLRPVFIWGRKDDWLYGIGARAGAAVVVVGAGERLPLTYGSNCADAFVTALESDRAWGETYNVDDGHEITRWRYAGLYQRATQRPGVRIPVPYLLGRIGTRSLAQGLACAGHREPRIPDMLAPKGYVARFRPLRYTNAKLKADLGWGPPHDLDECIRRTFGSQS